MLADVKLNLSILAFVPLLGLDLQLGISKAESGSRFEKNSPPEVLTVVTGSIRHRSRRSWSCSTEI